MNQKRFHEGYAKPFLKRMSKDLYKLSLFQESVPLKTAYPKQSETQVGATSTPSLLEHRNTQTHTLKCKTQGKLNISCSYFKVIVLTMGAYQNHLKNFLIFKTPEPETSLLTILHQAITDIEVYTTLLSDAERIRLKDPCLSL